MIRVPYNTFDKKLRPFIGVLFAIGEIEYFAPLSSPKEKHKTLKNTLDLIKIKDGELGVINFNNMIPVKNRNYSEYDFKEKNQDKKRNELLKDQLRWITRHHKSIMDIFIVRN